MNKSVMIAVLLFALTGCNTVAGLGKDLQAVGGALTDSADSVASGEGKPVEGDPSRCVPDAHGRVASPNC